MVVGLPLEKVADAVHAAAEGPEANFWCETHSEDQEVDWSWRQWCDEVARADANKENKSEEQRVRSQDVMGCSLSSSCGAHHVVERSYHPPAVNYIASLSTTGAGVVHSSFSPDFTWCPPGRDCGGRW